MSYASYCRIDRQRKDKRFEMRFMYIGTIYINLLLKLHLKVIPAVLLENQILTTCDLNLVVKAYCSATNAENTVFITNRLKCPKLLPLGSGLSPEKGSQNDTRRCLTLYMKDKTKKLLHYHSVF